MRVLFVDGVCPNQYDDFTLKTKPMGGTEATVVRVCLALKERGVAVRVVQHNREQADPTGIFCPFGSSLEFKPTHVVVLRAPKLLYTAKKQFPAAKTYLWCHDIFQGNEWAEGFKAIVDTQTVPVLVSSWHQTNMYELIRQLKLECAIPSRVIYNPVDPSLTRNTGEYDKNKLVFFSSPHKGLERTLEVFARFKDFDALKDCKLYVANPGYFKGKEIKQDNVVDLGPLSWPKVMAHVKEALCVFHLNNVFPETFGLVHAEANALGTPFLSSQLGATRELAFHPNEIIDVTDNKQIIDRVIRWKTVARPNVAGSPSFKLTTIVREWLEMLQLKDRGEA